MSVPGAIVVWSGNAPRLDAHRLSARALVLGRDHVDGSDDRISHAHASVWLANDRIAVEDLASRNGTYVNGERITGRLVDPAMPAVIRTGRTLSVLVPDVTPYEGAALVRHGALVVGGSLANAYRILERAALEESHLGIIGPMSVGRQLARRYAEIVDGERLVVELAAVWPTTLDQRLAGATPRTMILALDRPLTLPDQPELEAWLETDVRIVSLARDWDSFKFMPKELVARLTPRAIELPEQRFDELPSTIAERVAERAPGVTMHATVIEAALLHLRTMSEEALLRALDETIELALRRGATTLLGRDLVDHVETDAAMRMCHHGVPIGRRR